MHPLGAIMSGAQFQIMGGASDPGRMLKHTAEGLDKGGACHLAGAGSIGRRVVLRPVRGNIDAARGPYASDSLDVVHKSPKARCLAGATHQTAMQAHSH